jgi:hypothetical protein
MTMPEAAVNKHNGAPAGKNQIRPSRKLSIMQPIPEAARMQRSTYQHLRPGVLPPYAGHHPAADFGRDDVSHSLRTTPFAVEASV